MKKMNILVVLFSIIVTIIFIVIGHHSEAQAQTTQPIYRVSVSENVLNKPHTMTAWRFYGKCKKEWRETKFFEYYPTETKYRYTYKEELDCRRKLARFWIDQKKNQPRATNKYLDQLMKVYLSVYLPEYTYKYFKKSSWKIKKDRFRLKEYKKWAKKHIKGHRARTYATIKEHKFRAIK